MSRRTPSPTNTSYSGISNYRSDAYRPLRDRVDPVPKLPDLQDSRSIAKQHYEELKGFLASHLAKEPLNSRSSAREKLTRLTKQQFQELSTDVYDELIRRNNNSEQNEVPFLPVRDDFHPKRNQARQKLATLPKTRFKDLSSDVFYELGRRYPEFKEPEVLENQAEEGEYTDNEKLRNPAQDALREEDSSFNRKGSGDSMGSKRQGSNDSNPFGDPRRTPNGGGSSPYGDRRRPSEDQRSGGGGSMRRPSEDTIRTYGRSSKDGTLLGNGSYRKASRDSFTSSIAPSTATSGMIIPSKSTITEEEIQVPYGNDDDDSRDLDGSETDPTTGRPMPASKRTMSQGFGSLGANLLNTPISPTTEGGDPLDRRGQSEYFDQMSFGRASVASSAVLMSNRTREEREAAEQMRSEYEFKIATMQNRITTLEQEAANAKDARSSDEEKSGESSKELESLRVRVDDQAAVIRSLQRELEEAQAAKEQEARERQAESKRHSDYETQVRKLQDRIEEMERNGARRLDEGAQEDLRAEMQNLVDELKDLSQRNDELLAEKDADQVTIYNLTGQVKEYKRKYELAKTEMRNFKATSQLFQVQTPKMEESLPFSEGGGILDIHVTAFQTAIDNLLSVARSNQVSGVLSPMRTVVHAVSTINDDLRSFEQRSPRDRNGLDEDAIKGIRERVDATLSNLVAAIKNHATSHGLSPVSLVDAAASHVSAAVIAAIQTVMMRKSTLAERERERQQQQMAESNPGLGLSSTASSPQAKNGLPSGSLRSVDNLRGSDRHGRNPSDASSWSNGGSARNGTSSPLRKGSSFDQQRRGGAMSDRSSNPSPQPPPIFDTPTMGMNGTSEEEGSDEAWEELKPYLDAQSESIVLPIRNLLSAIRAGAGAAELNENLTQIITIVSSIVAVCKDSLPAASAKIGEEILQQLSENCSKLSELQSQGGEITKQTRQTMAASSFAVAKAMKELRGL